MNNRTYYTAQMLQDEQFMQFPKWLMQDSEFSKMSSDAKLLYTVLKDRFKLSYKNNWVDEKNRVFVVCKQETIAKLINKTEKTARKVLKELIDANLIEQKRNGLNKPNFIYLLMPKAKQSKNIEFEEDGWTNNDINESKEKSHTKNSWTGKNYRSKGVNITAQDTKKLPTNKNNSSNNKSSENILNDNINNTYKSRPFVVEKELDEYVKNILYKSNSFTEYLESGDLKPFINATERLIKIIKNQSKKRRNTICCFSESQILKLLEAALEAENNILDTFNNPDGYIVSKINSEIEAIT